MDNKNSTEQQAHCKVYKRCSGCQLMNMTYPEQLRFKEIKCVRSLGKYGRVEKIIGMENPNHYRNKVQSVFRKDRHGNILSGVYQSSNNGIVATDRCLLEDKKASRIISDIRNIVKECRITVYNPNTETGFLRHVLVRRGFSSGEIMVVIVSSSPVFQQKKIFTEKLLALHPEITTLILNVNESEKMTLGSKQLILHGKGFIEDVLCGKKFYISPKSFYQVNPVQTEKLYSLAQQLADLKGNEIVFDAYCGIGTIGIIASDKAKKVIGVEINSGAVTDAKKNAEINSVKNIEFYSADAGNVLAEIAQNNERLDVVFVDPPRAGCNRNFIRALLKAKPQKIVYISCNPETQGRDLFALCKDGYKAERICPVDMFPFTNHVESVVLLSRENS